MPAIEVKWPEKDLAAIAKQIHRAQDDLGKDIESAVIWAAYYLARSAGAATAKSATTRKTLPAPGGNPDFPKRIFPYYREIWKQPGGPTDTYRWYLREKQSDAKKRIKRSGLAKRSWRWMLPAIKYAGFDNFAVEVNKTGRAFSIEIEMANKLSYIRHALKSGQDGEPLLREALGKAASQMEKAIERRQKAMARR